VVQLHALPQYERTLEVERILMVDFAYAQAQPKEVDPPTCREGGWAAAAVAKPQSTSPPLTTDRVYKIYHQLAEIHAIATTQLAECAHWRQSDSTPRPVWAGTGRPRPVVMP
jgi:hypothetical protein